MRPAVSLALSVREAIHPAIAKPRSSRQSNGTPSESLPILASQSKGV